MSALDPRPGICIGLTPVSARIDRLGERRGDGTDPDSGEELFLVTSGTSVAVEEAEDGSLSLALEPIDPRPDSSRPLVLLGTAPGQGRTIWAADVPEPRPELDDPGRDLRDLRRVTPELDEESSQLALTAVGMAAWHRSMRLCPRCGAHLDVERDGWVLRCSQDGSMQFPRTDTAVIMAVRDEADRLLLAQNVNARGRFHSVLAGFVEPGETFEDAVAREALEEVGVTVERVEYYGSQPWPFPRSLMVGFRAWAPASSPLVLQDEEIAEADWYTRADLDHALASGALGLPGPGSIGRALIEDWYGSRLPD